MGMANELQWSVEDVEEETSHAMNDDATVERRSDEAVNMKAERERMAMRQDLQRGTRREKAGSTLASPGGPRTKVDLAS